MANPKTMIALAASVALYSSSQETLASAFTHPLQNDRRIRRFSRVGPSLQPIFPLIHKTPVWNFPEFGLQEKGAEEAVERTDAVVCGAGPAGLLTAIMLAQKFPTQQIRVFDRLSEPPSPDDEAVWGDVAKFYLVGLGFRGQKALMKFGVWDDVKARCVASPGRRDWGPGGPEEGVERIFENRPYTTQVIARDKMLGVLQQHILTNYASQIQLNYGYQVAPVDFGGDERVGRAGEFVRVRVGKCDPAKLGPRASPTLMASTGTTDDSATFDFDELCDAENSFLLDTHFLVGADGTARTVAAGMEEHDRQNRNIWWRPRSQFRITRFVDDNQRIYKTIPIHLPPDWRGDLNYSARGKNLNFDALPADRKGNYCGVLLLRKEDEVAQASVDPALMRKTLEESLPLFSAMLSDETVATVAKKPPSYLPAFRFAGPRLHQGDRTVILGDCAHTVKPYFGLGANTALEDVQCLSDALDQSPHDLGRAVRLFSRRRAGEAKAIVRLSRQLDRPGLLGVAKFIVPLLMDSIFHRMAPKLFAPNVLSMFQKEGVNFRGIQRRKRWDRLVQVTIIFSLVSALVSAVRMSILGLARVTGQGNSVVVGGLAAALVAGRFIQQQLGFFFQEDLAPADVINKTKDKVTGSDTFLPTRKAARTTD